MADPATDDDVWGIEKVAGLLDCSNAQVEELLRRRLLPGLKPGRHWRIPRAALLKVLNDLALKHVDLATTGAPAPTPTGEAGDQPGARPASPRLHVVKPPTKAKTTRRTNPPPLPDPPLLGAKA